MHLSFDFDQRVEQLFTELIHEPWGRDTGSKLWQPAVDVFETEAEYILEVELPGLLPENIELHISGRELSIRGRRASVKVSQKGLSLSTERAQGEFVRKFTLTHLVDAARVETWYENGIYRARLPKMIEPLP